MTAPLVSAIIPTRNRPQWVTRAARSALDQTEPSLEVIVVIDGPDAATEDALRAISDPRLRVLALPGNRGPSAARNVGIAAAEGYWIALLDDDDVWFETKIERQLALSRHLDAPDPILTHRAVYRFPDASSVEPARPIAPGEPLSDYLLTRPGVLERPGAMPASSIMAPRSLFLRLPFPNEPENEDWAWLLLAAREAGVEIAFVWEALSEYRVAEDSSSRSASGGWRLSFDWAEKYRPYMTPSAYASFLLTRAAAQARQSGEWRAIGTILGAALVNGRPRLHHLIAFLCILAAPRALYSRLWRRSYRLRAD